MILYRRLTTLYLYGHCLVNGAKTLEHYIYILLLLYKLVFVPLVQRVPIRLKIHLKGQFKKMMRNEEHCSYRRP